MAGTGDAEIFAAGSSVLLWSVNICRQEAAGPCSPWQDEQKGAVCLAGCLSFRSNSASGSVGLKEL